MWNDTVSRYVRTYQKHSLFLAIGFYWLTTGKIIVSLPTENTHTYMYSTHRDRDKDRMVDSDPTFSFSFLQIIKEGSVILKRHRKESFTHSSLLRCFLYLPPDWVEARTDSRGNVNAISSYVNVMLLLSACSHILWFLPRAPWVLGAQVLTPWVSVLIDWEIRTFRVRMRTKDITYRLPETKDFHQVNPSLGELGNNIMKRKEMKANFGVDQNWI